jgi:hypothetical protein
MPTDGHDGTNGRRICKLSLKASQKKYVYNVRVGADDKNCICYSLFDALMRQ